MINNTPRNMKLMLAAAVAAAGLLWVGEAVAQVKVRSAEPAQAKVSSTPPVAVTLPKLPPHSDTAYARELLRLGQPDLLRAVAESQKIAPVGSMFAAETVIADWADVAKSRAKLAEATESYLSNVQRYMDSQPEGVDAGWALDQAKFLMGGLSEAIMNRMEFWSNNKRDREALRPRAELVKKFLKVAGDRVAAEVAVMESDTARSRFPSDDAYARAYEKVKDIEADINYNRCTALYFEAMSMEPGDAARNDLLAKAAEELKTWTEGGDEANPNPVKYPSLLLRGKVFSEARKIGEAITDLQSAGADAAPPWVQYQSRYQMVVAKMRSRDFKSADDELAKFRAWIDSHTKGPDQAGAKTSADMLGYRVEWAKAEAMPEGKEREEARSKALAVLSAIVAREPTYRELVYEQLAAQVGEGEDLSKVQPLQALAVAWTRAQVAVGKDAASLTDPQKAALNSAINAAKIVREKSASPSEQLEATLIAGVCSTQLGRLVDAARYNIEFWEKAPPTDKRRKELLELALDQLGQIRQDRRNVTPEVAELMERALRHANSPDKGSTDNRWKYPYGVTLEEQGKLDEARKVFASIPPSDKFYIDAQYRLVGIGMQKMVALENAKAPADELRTAAGDLLRACTEYLRLVEKADAETKTRVKPYLVGLRMVQVSTALNPLRDHASALQGLETLEKEAADNQIELTAAQKGTILRYRIMAYQLAGKPELALKEVEKLPEKDRVDTIKGLVYENIKEIDTIEKSDPARAKDLADLVTTLLTRLIDLTKGRTDNASLEQNYSLQQLLAEMLGRAGKTDESVKLWNVLQKAYEADKDPEVREKHRLDLLNFMGEARALFIRAQTTRDPKDVVASRDIFIKLVPKLQPGGESYWEAYLRIFQLNEIDGKGLDDMKRKLKDLKASYGAATGGTQLKGEYEKLFQKYGI